MKYLFIIVLMTCCGCNILFKDDTIVWEVDSRFVEVDFRQIEDKYTLSMKCYDETHKGTATGIRSDSGTLFVPPIDIVLGKPFEWSILNENETAGFFVHGYMNEDDNGVRVTCTYHILEVLKTGQEVHGFQDRSFELNTTTRIPLYYFASRPIDSTQTMPLPL